jgi:hypothetical protein
LNLSSLAESGVSEWRKNRRGSISINVDYLHGKQLSSFAG